MADRTVMTVLREIATVKAQVKEPVLLATLLGPLEAELSARAKAFAGQGALPLDPTDPSKTAKK